MDESYQVKQQQLYEDSEPSHTHHGAAVVMIMWTQAVVREKGTRQHGMFNLLAGQCGRTETVN